MNLGVLFLTMWINSCQFHNFTDSYLVLRGLKLGNGDFIISLGMVRKKLSLNMNNATEKIKTVI